MTEVASTSFSLLQFLPYHNPSVHLLVSGFIEANISKMQTGEARTLNVEDLIFSGTLFV